MPRHLKLKKDATNGETRRGAVRKQRSAGIRMGEPGMRNSVSSADEQIVCERGTRELKHLSTRRKRKQQ